MIQLVYDMLIWQLLLFILSDIFIILFCLPKKEPKKGPAKRLHPVCRKQLCAS